MLPSEYLNYFFFIFLQRIGILIGLEFMLPTFKISWRTARFVCGMVSGVLAQLYTIITRDRMLALRCSTTIAIALQGAVKYIVFLAKARPLCENLAYLQRIYRQCDGVRAEASQLIVWAKISKKGIVVFVSVVCSAAACFSALPPYIFVTTGDMVMLMPIQIPGLDETTAWGFVGQTACQILLMLMVAVGLAGSDLTMFLFIVQICPLSEIIIIKMRILEAALRRSNVDTRREVEHRSYLHNIVRMHVEFVDYVGAISNLLYVVYLFEILSNSVGMCLIMFVLMQEVWFPLYMFWITYFFKTFLVCSLGTLTEYYLDKLREAVQRFPWYKLPLVDQRGFLLIIQRVQHPKLLMCGTVPLNLELFVVVMKNTYSVAMLLMTFEE